MGIVKDISGQRFGNLVAVKRTGKMDSGRHSIWLCKCDCGTEFEVSINNLSSGNTTSCGCIRKLSNGVNSIKHGKSNTRLYRIWHCMRNRCNNSKNPKHTVYFDRNITVCDEWLNDFRAFYDWSMANGYSDKLTIDRIDNDKGYNPDNCRWATQKEQQRNKRNNHNITYNGETHCLIEWCELLNLNYGKIKTRINDLNWNIERAFTTP